MSAERWGDVNRSETKDGLEFGVASRPQEVVEAWALVYRQYVRTRLIPQNPHQVFTVPEAISSGTAVIIGQIRSLVVATMTAYPDQSTGLPLDATCSREMTTLRRQGRRLVEVGLFADRREKIARSFSALMNLMRYTFFYAVHVGGTDLVVGVHPRHAPFYRRCLGFTDFAPPTCCDRVNDHPMVPLRLNLETSFTHERLPRGLAFFQANPLLPEAYASRLQIHPHTFKGTTVEGFLHQFSHPGRTPGDPPETAAQDARPTLPWGPAL